MSSHVQNISFLFLSSSFLSGGGRLKRFYFPITFCAGPSSLVDKIDGFSRSLWEGYYHIKRDL